MLHITETQNKSSGGEKTPSFRLCDARETGDKQRTRCYLWCYLWIRVSSFSHLKRIIHTLVCDFVLWTRTRAAEHHFACELLISAVISHKPLQEPLFGPCVADNQVRMNASTLPPTATVYLCNSQHQSLRFTLRWVLISIISPNSLALYYNSWTLSGRKWGPFTRRIT